MDTGNPRESAQNLLDQPQAGAAGNALEDQRSFAICRFSKINIVNGSGAGSVRRPRLVVALEAARDDGRGDRLAAGAAKLALRSEKKSAVPAGLQDRQAAMEAGAQETAMRFAAPLDFLGSIKLSTPSLYSALAPFSSTSTGSVKLRDTMP